MVQTAIDSGSKFRCRKSMSVLAQFEYQINRNPGGVTFFLWLSVPVSAWIFHHQQEAIRRAELKYGPLSLQYQPCICNQLMSSNLPFVVCLSVFPTVCPFLIKLRPD